MKKKTYTRPHTNIINVETEGIICNSFTMQISSPAEEDSESQPSKDEDNGFWLAE